MANDSVPLFNYYLRYPWGPADFSNLQDGLVDMMRDSLGALHGAGLMFGGTVAPSGSISGVTVTALTAVNDDGYLLVTNETRFVDMSNGNGSNPRYDLIVARPLLTTGAQISRPTSPYDTVDLTTLQQCELVVIEGTPAGSPSAPSKVAGDVILATILVPTSATSISGGNINQTTAYDNGNCVRFASAVTKQVVLRARGTNQYALDAYGSGTAPAARMTGQGTGTGASDDALELVQNLFLSGSNPAATTAFLNRLTKANIVKAWGLISATVTTPTILAGFNIAGLTYESFDSQIRVQLAGDMASVNYAPIVSKIAGGTDIAYGANMAVGTFDIFDSGESTISGTGAYYAFVVLGLQ